MGNDMVKNLEIWEKVKEVPKQAQKLIKAGRLKGMTDILPQWRYNKMTEIFGPVGIGWKFTIDRQWLDDGSDGQRCAMTNISLYVKYDGEWSAAIPGTGGNTFVAKERNGLYTSDEAFKMSLTDALSVAMKMLGVGALIYSGGNDYSKYTAPQNNNERDPSKYITEGQLANIEILVEQAKADEKQFCAYLGVKGFADIPSGYYTKAIKALEAKKAQL